MRSYHVKAFGDCGEVEYALVVFCAKDGATLHVEYVNLCGLGSRHEQRAACKLHGDAARRDELLDGFDAILFSCVLCCCIFFGRVRGYSILLRGVLGRLECLESHQDTVECGLRFQIVVIDKAFLSVQSA